MTVNVTRFFPAVMATLLLSVGVQEAQAGLARNWEESGQASWYGPGFHGGRTTSGARFDQQALTAAHDMLPLGTRVRVTMQETGQSVDVTITDRMPAKRVRVIDLSRGAAQQIGLISRGVGMVTLTEAPAGEPIEVAEAPDDDADAVSPRRRGRPHTRHGARTASGHRGCCHAPSASLARR